ncbi:MAG TPA: MiaB/RimO family radical SAM methylthiotransferase [Myxococcota bacterium]|nr:MiaB/RimO family radical SAM methylthiotransferase [Myxococcota bacterium]
MPAKDSREVFPGGGGKVRLAFRTTGCKVNQFDTEAILEAVSDMPVIICDPDDRPDLVVVNACTVTMNADRDGRAAAFRALRTGAGVILAGCMATRLQDQGTASTMPPEISIIGGTADRSALLSGIRERVRKILASGLPEPGRDAAGVATPPDDVHPAITAAATKKGVRARPLVKIQDGCDCRCTYCIVPLVRGASTSRSIDDILNQVRRAADAGAAEIVLTGVDLAAWGRNSDGRYGRLDELLVRLTAAGTGSRFRLSSLEPHGLSRELLDSMAASPDICPHLHIPMQSGSDAVLARMNRPYSAGRFAELVMEAAARVPGLVLGMDVIAGFPGETDRDFLLTLEMVQALPTTYLHVFPYSPRPGTPAATMDDQVPDGIRKERARALRQFGTRARSAHAGALTGSTVEVVDIRVGPEGVEALAADYTRVFVTNRHRILDGRTSVRIVSSRGAVAIGRQEE